MLIVMGNMSTQNVSISGPVNLDGTIGGWTVDDTTASMAQLRDSNTRIKFDPSLPEIQLYDSSTNRKSYHYPNENLTSPGSTDISVNNIGSTTNGSTVSSTTTNSYTSVVSSFVQSTTSNFFQHWYTSEVGMLQMLIFQVHLLKLQQVYHL